MRCRYPYTHLLLLILVCIASWAHADEAQVQVPEDLTPLAPPNIELGVSSLVGGCVNAITGDYIECHADLCVAGPEPLIFERFHASSDPRYCLTHGWRHNYDCYTMFDAIKRHHTTHAEYCYVNPMGMSGTFVNNAQFGFRMPLDMNKKGVTNCYSGEISARTNIKNLSLKEFSCYKFLKYITPSGATQRLDWCEEKKAYFLTSEKRLNKHRLELHRDDKSRLQKVKLRKLHGETTYSSLTLSSLNKHAIKKYEEIEVTASDGRSVTYSLDGSAKNGYRIEKVSADHLPLHRYSYKSRSGDGNKLIVASERGGQRREIEYYTKKDTDSSSDFRVNRVKTILEQVGTGDEPIPIFRFEYEAEVKTKKHEKPDPLQGRTDVYNAYNHKTSYHYSKAHRLTAVEKFLFSNTALYSRQSFDWAEDKGDYGNLLGSFWENGQGQVLKAHCLEYNGDGNVIRERIYGNISGRSAPLPKEHKALSGSGCDCQERLFEYNKHLLPAKVVESSGLVSCFAYKHETDLVLTNMVSGFGNGKKIRNFYEYNSDGIVCRSVTDDGLGASEADLSGVTFRRETVIQPSTQAPYGYPLSIEVYSRNMATGDSGLLSLEKRGYNPKGELAWRQVYDSKRALSYTLEWGYDLHGNVILERDALGYETRRKYSPKDELVEELLPSGVVRKYDYDYAGRRIREAHTEPSGCLTKRYFYDLVGNCTRVEDACGNATEYEYDEFGRCTLEILPPIEVAEGCWIWPQTAKGYDTFGNVTSVTDPLGHVTRTEYNTFGKPISIHYPDGSQESFEYDMAGRLTKTVARNGLITLCTYDALDRLLKKESVASEGTSLSSISHVYDAFHLIRTTDAEGIVTEYTYDSAGRMASKSSGSTLSTYGYDELGRLHRSCEWYSSTEYRETIKLFDTLNRVVEERVQDSRNQELLKRVRYTYDTDSNITSETRYTEAGAAVTRSCFNGRKQPVLIIDPLGGATHFEYNYKGRHQDQTVLIATQTDPLGNWTITLHNTHQKPAEVVKKNSLGEVISKVAYVYDAAGNRIEVRDHVIGPTKQLERVLITRFSFNAMHQPTATLEAVGSERERHTYTRYNRAGQKQATCKPDGVEILYDYDAYGRVAALSTSDGTVAYTYAYDRNSHLIEVVNGLEGTRTVRQYDENGWLTSETLDTGVAVSSLYDRLGRPCELQLPDGSSLTYEYNACSLTRLIRRDASQNELYSHSYLKHDLVGNVIEMLIPREAGKIKLENDLMGRIAQIDAPQFQERIAYDAVGNILQIDRMEGEHAISSHYSYDDLYQLRSEEGAFNGDHTYLCDSLFNCVQRDGQVRLFDELNQLRTQGETAYDYDRNGRLTSRRSPEGEVFYSYDGLDRLVEVRSDRERTQYTYDSFHRRLSKKSYLLNVAEWELQSSQAFLYIGQNEVGSLNESGEIAEFRVLGTGKGAEIGAAVALELAGNLYIPVHDHNGNITLLLDPEGRVVERYHTSAFGEERIFDAQGSPLQRSSVGNPWRFSSKRIDAETGFVCFGRRYYDPSTMRWSTPDPLGYDAGPNLYAYVMNNPLGRVDLYGLDWLSGLGWGGFNFNFLNALSSGLTSLWRGLEIPFQKGFHPRPHSKNFTVGEKEHPNMSFSFTNGANTSKEDCLKQTSDLYQKVGYKIHATWNATHNLFWDIVDCVAAKLGIETGAIRKQVKSFREQLAKLGTDGIIYHFCHSEGGTITYRALKQLTPDERRRIHVITFGSATIIDPKEHDLHGAMNYISKQDIVPWTDTLTRLKIEFNKPDWVEFYSSDQPFGLRDHGMNGESYRQARSHAIDQVKYLL